MSEGSEVHDPVNFTDPVNQHAVRDVKVPPFLGDLTVVCKTKATLLKKLGGEL